MIKNLKQNFINITKKSSIRKMGSTPKGIDQHKSQKVKII